MVRIRHLLLSFLAVVGLITALGMAGPSMACPIDPQSAAAMPHQANGCGHGAPLTSHEAQLCPACVAVLPSPALVEPRAVLPFAASASRIRPLSGADPALDPPPPRAA